MRVRIRYQCMAVEATRQPNGNYVTLYLIQQLFKKETAAKRETERVMKDKLKEGYELINKTCMRKGDVILNFFIQKVRVLDK